MLPCHHGKVIQVMFGATKSSGLQQNGNWVKIMGSSFHCLLAHQVKNTSIFPGDTLHAAAAFPR